MKIYISFGQSHVHRVNNTTFDCNCLCEINCENYEEGRAKAFDVFDGIFATSYTEEKAKEALHFFPDGIKPLERNSNA